MNAQAELFPKLTPPSTSPIGLPVILPHRCSNCGAEEAVIGSSRRPHYARLNCSYCGLHRGWMRSTTFGFIKTIIDTIGRPTAPIMISQNSRREGVDVSNRNSTAAEAAERK